MGELLMHGDGYHREEVRPAFSDDWGTLGGNGY
jgi:hypothetical protein